MTISIGGTDLGNRAGDRRQPACCPYSLTGTPRYQGESSPLGCWR